MEEVKDAEKMGKKVNHVLHTWKLLELLMEYDDIRVLDLHTVFYTLYDSYEENGGKSCEMFHFHP